MQTQTQTPSESKTIAYPAEFKSEEYWMKMKIGAVKAKCAEYSIPMPKKRDGSDYVKTNKTIVQGILNFVNGVVAPAKSAKAKKGSAGENSSNVIVKYVNVCHNILRNTCAITGEKAMHDIVRVMFMKFLEPLIDNGTVDILDQKYYKDEPEFVDGTEKLAKWSIFTDKSHKSVEYLDNSNVLWNTIFANHPLTDQIFKSNGKFICSGDALKNIFYEADAIIGDSKFINMDCDVKGKIYEEFLNGYSNGAGKSFGQYFTTRKYINLIFGMIDPEWIAKFADLKVLDPFMGTAGFLTEAIKLFKSAKCNVFGTEIESETFSYALMNIILSTGGLNPKRFKCADSLADCTPLAKFDFIPTNPPYGTKMNYKTLNTLYNQAGYKDVKQVEIPFESVYPIQTNNGIALSLQMIIYKLKEGGLSTVIIPNGEIISGKNFIGLRRYIMSRCAIEKILYVPSGAFKHTGVRTAVLFMRRFRNNSNREISFYETDKFLTEVKFLAKETVRREKNYSWEFKTYKIAETHIFKHIEYKTLGELCEFLPKSKRAASFGQAEGKYPFYTSSAVIMRCNVVDYDDQVLIIGTGGNANIKIDSHCSCSADNQVLRCSDTVIPYMVYYYLSSNLDIIQSKFSGSSIQHISKTDLEDIKIPVLPLEVQTKIVAELDELNRDRESLIKSIETLELEIARREKFDGPIFDNDVEYKTLGELCEFLPKSKRAASFGQAEGKYPFYTSSAVIMRCNVVDYDDQVLIIGTGGNANIKIDSHCSCSADNQVLRCSDTVIPYMVYYYLSSNLDIIQSKFSGSSIQHISKTDLEDIKIPVPPLEVQTRYIQIYQEKAAYIQKLRDNIASLKETTECYTTTGKKIIDYMCSHI